MLPHAPQFRAILALLLIFVVSLVGCNSHQSTLKTKKTPDLPQSAAFFKDIAEKSGVKFIHVLGNAGKYYYIESTPSGCAFLDYNNDGYQDIFLVQSGSSAPATTVLTRPFGALFLNQGDGTFKDVTSESGLDKNLGYGQGVAVGDYDNDGFDDLLVTAYGGNHLFHNLHGSGKFQDVTQSMGLGGLHDTGFATSAAWGDYDNDGKLDLYICYYSHWSYALDKPCYVGNTKLRDYCPPTVYPAVTHQLFHNTGQRFVDVSQQSGIAKVIGRGLSAAFLDYNGDRKQDIFVANDQTSCMLWRNNGNGTFTDVAEKVGCAYDGQGQLLAGMGIAMADYDHSGHQSLYISNFSSRANILYKNDGNYFMDVTDEAGLGFSHLKLLSFGCAFLDYDADGWPDLLTNNGHVQMQAGKREAGVPLKMRKQLLHNQGNGTFKEVNDASVLGDLNVPVIGRGLATGDYDNDGRVDVLAMSQNGPVQLFHNLVPRTHHWVSIQTIGTVSNRDGIGARLEIVAGGARQVAMVSGGSSYLSSSDKRVYFGLGKAARIDRISINWPSGTKKTWRALSPDKFYIIKESGELVGHIATSAGTTPNAKREGK
ncbi:hypothetical protein IAD21_02830 [Abditibacteriota bacterium]|nr:hypothetical protein IAD21_02830 [Abditibacteriota bacterium]